MLFEGLIKISPITIEIVMGCSLAVLAIKFVLAVKGLFEKC